MKVSELRKIIKDLPGDMEVILTDTDLDSLPLGSIQTKCVYWDGQVYWEDCYYENSDMFTPKEWESLMKEPRVLQLL